MHSGREGFGGVIGPAIIACPLLVLGLSGFETGVSMMPLVAADGNPLSHLLRYLILGRGDTTPVVREIIRQHEPDPTRRPGIHVG